jgi:mevalonate kinase
MAIMAMTDMTKTIEGQASGKLILIGEHAVVHGQPAIAVPFTRLQVTANVGPFDGPLSIDCGIYKGPLENVPELLKGWSMCVFETLKRLGSPMQGLVIRISSTIPLGRGLGSSAAVAAATVRSLFAYHGKTATHKELMDLVNISEVYAHGSPSGIDSEAVTSEKPIWFKKGEQPESITIGHPVQLVVADSGQVGDTYGAVQGVQERLLSAPEMVKASLNHIGHLAKEARHALSSGSISLLGNVINEAQNELRNIGVSNGVLNHLISAAQHAGALGAKLTGSGRGGCIFALAEDRLHAKRIKTKLYEAGARAVWRFTIREDL